MKNKIRNVTAVDLLVALVTVVLGIGGFAVSHLYSQLIGFSMIGILLIIVGISWTKVSQEEKSNISKVIQKHEQSPFGKFMQYLEMGFVIFMVIVWFLYIKGK